MEFKILNVHISMGLELHKIAATLLLPSIMSLSIELTAVSFQWHLCTQLTVQCCHLAIDAV